MNGENSEPVIVKLTELFNYSSIVITKSYLESLDNMTPMEYRAKKKAG